MTNKENITKKVSDTMDILNQVSPVNGSDLYMHALSNLAIQYANGTLAQPFGFWKTFKPFAAAAVLFLLLNAGFFAYINTAFQPSGQSEYLDEYISPFYDHYTTLNTTEYYELLQE